MTKFFLTGMMGSGKSTLGRALAAELGILFVDLDEALVALIGQSVPQIFESHGEEEFRRMETGILEQFCSMNESFVMATGGGTPCFAKNQENMENAGLTVFLDVPIQELVKRLETKRSNRPLIGALPADELYDYLEKMRDVRQKCYKQAQFILKGEKIGISDFRNAGII